MLPTAARCLRITRSMASAFFRYSSNGPIRLAISADLRYARPVMIAVIAAAYARPSSESYASPRAIRSAPRLAYPRPSWRIARRVLGDLLGRVARV